jgi:chromosomal replication initiation ATPase DnaA
MKPTLCVECSAANDVEIENLRVMEQARKLEAKRQELIREIEAATPPRFRQTDVRHPGFNLAAWQKIQAWTPTDEKPWCGLMGATGACKTRMGYLIAGKYLLDRFTAIGHTNFAFVQSTDISEAIMRSFSDTPLDKHEARAYLDGLRKCDLLLIDDLGKGRLTPAPAAEIFALIDHRHAHNMATIWTSNSTPQQIAATLPEDLGGPLAGRLNECSKIFSLK